MRPHLATLAAAMATMGLVLAGCSGVKEAPTPPSASLPGLPASPVWSEIAGPETTMAVPDPGEEPSSPQTPPLGDDQTDPSPTSEWVTIVDAVPQGQAEGCTDTTTPFSCGGKFRAILAYSAGESVPWIEEGTTRVEAVRMGGQTTLVVLTPCNTINLPVTITQGKITPGEAITGTMGCAGEAAAAEQWLLDLLESPFTFHFRGPDNLVLTKDRKEVVLARV